MSKIKYSDEERYNIRLSTSKERYPIEAYKAKLEEAGFVYNQRANWFSTFYELKNAEPEETEKWEKFAKQKGLKFVCVEEKYTRSGDYRDTFFKEYKPAVPAKYRCAYCGRKFIRRKITVDHIFPVNKLMYQQTTRDAAKLYGISGANDAKNLVAACRRCNSKKGTKMGLWIVRGFLGRSELLWKIRKLARIAIIAVIYYEIFGLSVFGSEILRLNLNTFAF